MNFVLKIENRHLERVGDDYSHGAVLQSLLRRWIRRGRATALHAEVYFSFFGKGT
jgi:hypothetical protein